MSANEDILRGRPTWEQVIKLQSIIDELSLLALDRGEALKKAEADLAEAEQGHAAWRENYRTVLARCEKAEAELAAVKARENDAWGTILRTDELLVKTIADRDRLAGLIREWAEAAREIDWKRNDATIRLGNAEAAMNKAILDLDAAKEK